MAKKFENKLLKIAALSALGLFGGVRQLSDGTVKKHIDSNKVVGTISEKDFKMSQDEADMYLKEEIHPILDQLIGNPRMPESIKVRVLKLFDEVRNGKLLYYAVPANNFRGDIAKIDYDVKTDLPILYVFVPALQERIKSFAGENMSISDQACEIGIILAHEYIHIEQEARNPTMRERAGKQYSALDAPIEAEAWGLTVTQLIQPAIQNGWRLSSNLRLNSQLFDDVKNDWHDPKWMEAFDPSRQRKK